MRSRRGRFGNSAGGGPAGSRNRLPAPSNGDCPRPKCPPRCATTEAARAGGSPPRRYKRTAGARPADSLSAARTRHLCCGIMVQPGAAPPPCAAVLAVLLGTLLLSSTASLGLPVNAEDRAQGTVGWRGSRPARMSPFELGPGHFAARGGRNRFSTFPGGAARPEWPRRPRRRCAPQKQGEPSGAGAGEVRRTESERDRGGGACKEGLHGRSSPRRRPPQVGTPLSRSRLQVGPTSRARVSLRSAGSASLSEWGRVLRHSLHFQRGPESPSLPPLQCVLAGTWVNELGSKMTISAADSAGQFSGSYLTAVTASNQPIRRSSLRGSQQLPSQRAQPTFGFTVQWLGSGEAGPGCLPAPQHEGARKRAAAPE